MAFSDVRDNVQFSGFNPTDQSALLAALEYLYTNSSSAKDTLDIINSDFKLSITYEANNASAIPNGYQVYFDVSYVSAIKYYDKNGNLRSFTTADLLMHEVIHAIEGTGDVKYDSLLDSPTADFYGPTVTKTNTIMSELGFAAVRAGYTASVLPGVVVPNEATFGRAIDFAFVEPAGGLSFGLDRSGDSRNFLLITPNSDSETIRGGSGQNFIYAAAGNDKLYGGAGSDYLNGGEGNDLLVGSTNENGDDLVVDYLVGESGNDTYKLINTRDVARSVHEVDASGNALHGSINREMFKVIDIIADSDGSGTIVYKSQYANKGGGGLIGDIDLSGDWKKLAGLAENADQVNGLEPVWFKQVTVNGSWWWNIYAMPISWINPITGKSASGIVFFENLNNDLFNYRAIGAVEGFNNGSFGINLKDYSGSGAPPAPTAIGTTASDVLRGDDRADAIFGAGGDDYIEGQGGDDQLFGELGNDTLSGGAGNDTIVAGEGEDMSGGGDGSDIYVYASGDGDDIINDGSESASDIDVLRIRDLNSDGITLSRADGDLLIGINGTGQTITVRNHFYSQSENWGIEKIEFADGSSWDLATINANAWFRGTGGDDANAGSLGNDVFLGGGGNDYYEGRAGSDIYVYASGDGDDIINDGSESASDIDVLRLTDLNSDDITLSRVDGDLLIGINGTGQTITVRNHFYSQSENWGIEKIEFADGSSWDLATINANAWFRGTGGDDANAGSLGNDVFLGGGGNDYYEGRAGSDTYVYASSDGGDVINDGSKSTSDIDVLRLTDLNSDDIAINRYGSDLFIWIESTWQTITVKNQFYSQSENWGIEKIEFADGSSWDLAAINANTWYDGSGDPTVGPFGDDVFLNGSGDDYSEGWAGSDTYVYTSGGGNDVINDNYGSASDVDVLHLTDLNSDDVTLSRVDGNLLIGINATGETITVSNQFYLQSENWGIEKIEFADGSSWDLATINAKAWYRGTGDGDHIVGSPENDVFLDESGNGYYEGWAGSDTYIHAPGSGNDVINDNYGSASEVDTLRLSDLNPDDITLSRIDGNLLVGINDTGQTITVSNQFYLQSENWGIEKIEFANGSSWDLATINANAWTRGTSGNDSVSGSIWNDTIYGDAGNDTLSGGAGNDTFVFKADSGRDIVTDFSVDHDILEFRDNIFADSGAVLAAATASGDDTIITIDASTQILLKNVALANLHVDDFRVV